MNNEKYISEITAGSHESASTLGFNKDNSTIESTLDDSRSCDLFCGNSTTSTTSDDLVKHLSKQAELYRGDEKEEENSLVKNAIQNYLREIFRSVKFFSDSKGDYKEPDFVSEEGKKRQTARICKRIFTNLKCRDDAHYVDLVKFWKTYRKYVKKLHDRMRQSDICAFKLKFQKGKTTEINYFLFFGLLTYAYFLVYIDNYNKANSGFSKLNALHK